MQIKIESNFQEVRRRFASMAKQVDFAAAVALTRTAKDLQAATPAQLERDLDKPTDFTKRGLYVVAARRDRLEATVAFKDRQAKYMGLQIGGGVYRPKDTGIRLPGNIQLNAFGNIPRGTIARLKAAAKDGKLGAVVTRRLGVERDRRKGAAAIQLFVGKPTGRGWEKAPMGIWRRIPPATPGAPGKLVPVIVFEDTPAVYRPRFDFAALARKTANERFGKHFDTEFTKALATAR